MGPCKNSIVTHCNRSTWIESHQLYIGVLVRCDTTAVPCVEPACLPLWNINDMWQMHTLDKRILPTSWQGQKVNMQTKEDRSWNSYSQKNLPTYIYILFQIRSRRHEEMIEGGYHGFEGGFERGGEAEEGRFWVLNAWNFHSAPPILTLPLATFTTALRYQVWILYCTANLMLWQFWSFQGRSTTLTT